VTEFSERDRELMALAITEAERAGQLGDVPIGAVIASEGHVISFAGNERERRNDPTAHAEMIVMRAAAARMGGWRLPATTLYVTLEPCAMCAGAIVLARVPRVIFATPDPKAGAVGSVFDILGDERLNHRPKVESGLKAEESAQILRNFFAERR
jgi:tRNA(adenine34) deaminase